MTPNPVISHFTMPYWGTHDSFSYVRPQFLMLFLRMTCQTQTLTIEEQYDWGARIFDFRLKWKNGRMISGHGPCTFDVNVTQKVEWLANQGNVSIRFMIENHEDEALYIDYYNDLVRRFSPRIQFIGLWRKYDMLQLVPGNGSIGTDYTIEPGYENGRFPFPAMYAEQFNWKNWERINKGEYGIIDFPEITRKLHDV